MTQYLLDTNVLIEAKNRHYGFDFCPAFWEWLERSNHDGIVFSNEKVQDELVGGGDDLADWARAQPDTFFLRPDAAVVPSLRDVSTWANAQGYEQGAVNAFLAGADYYLVAHAHAHDVVVVTHEIFSDSLKRIKIPNACIGMDVKFVTPFVMLRMESARFVLPNGNAPPPAAVAVPANNHG